MSSMALLGSCAGLIAVSIFLLWLVSLALRDVSIVDIFWGVGFALVAVASALLGRGAETRRLLVAGLATVWGLRLAIHLARRNLGRGEDFRYAAMRAHHGPSFRWLSLLTVFGLQGMLMWIIALPLMVSAAASEPSRLGWIEALGACLWVIGFAFEVIGDAQLARFKADPTNQGRVMDRGLWRYTRHPNYFGDALLWWGLFLTSGAASGAWWTVVSPLLMTTLLLKVSGVALLESTIAERRPGYRGYVERTSAFVPWPPKRR